jgi:glutamyl-tRNA reductase
LEHKLNLCDREKKLLKKVLDASLIRLMREPIQELKKVEEEQEQANYQQLLEKLFRLNEEEEG